MINRPTAGLVLVASFAAIYACSGGQGGERQDCYPNGTCNAGLTCASGVCVVLDGGATDAPTDGPPTCDPMTNPNCITEADGVFVKSGASATGAGTKADPVGTITDGIAKAKTAGKAKIYVCAGTYAEALLVKDSVAVLGGLDCATWAYGAMNTVTVKPAAGIPLKVEGVSVSVSDVAFVAPVTTMDGESSIAGFAVNATLLLRRVGLEAQEGKAAVALADPPGFGMAAPNGNNGTATGGAPQPNNCSNGTGNSSGAIGGSSSAGGGSGTPAIMPVNPPGATGAGGIGGMACGSGGEAKNGSWGQEGNGGTAAMSFGTLDMSGWVPAAGGAATAGKVGQGGGGGASVLSNFGGGGGGPGGCGGIGGQGGAGGGGSVALALMNTSATLQACSLVAKGGGAGAQGQKGEQAQRAGNGGINGGGLNSEACVGGNGGHGGSGGGGAGGTGGLSVGILYTGTAPKIDGTSVSDAQTQAGITTGTAGTPGAAGAGGAAAFGGQGNPGKTGAVGKAGVAKAVLAAQ